MLLQQVIAVLSLQVVQNYGWFVEEESKLVVAYDTSCAALQHVSGLSLKC